MSASPLERIIVDGIKLVKTFFAWKFATTLLTRCKLINLWDVLVPTITVSTLPRSRHMFLHKVVDFGHDILYTKLVEP
jgi:hypothetical protein